jgi:hypothetical protein
VDAVDVDVSNETCASGASAIIVGGMDGDVGIGCVGNEMNGELSGICE